MNQHKEQIVGLKYRDRSLGIAAALLFAAGIYGHYHYTDISLLVKFAAWLTIITIEVALFWFTCKGKKAFTFIHDAYLELYKVAWPTRRETYQSTIAVVLIVAVIALLVWGIDSVLIHVVRILTGR